MEGLRIEKGPIFSQMDVNNEKQIPDFKNLSLSRVLAFLQANYHDLSQKLSEVDNDALARFKQQAELAYDQSGGNSLNKGRVAYAAAVIALSFHVMSSVFVAGNSIDESSVKIIVDQVVPQMRSWFDGSYEKEIQKLQGSIQQIRNEEQRTSEKMTQGNSTRQSISDMVRNIGDSETRSRMIRA